MKETGGPAFPTDEYFDEARIGQCGGMTLRDYFAAKAIQGELSCQSENFCVPEKYFDSLARRCYAVADAMLAERNKP